MEILQASILKWIAMPFLQGIFPTQGSNPGLPRCRWILYHLRHHESHQSILKEINPEQSLEGLMLKLHLQYFGYLMWRANSLEKILILGKTEGKRRRGWQWMGWLDSITNSMHINLNKLWEIVKDREAWSAAVHRIASASHEWLNDWTTR